MTEKLQNVKNDADNDRNKYQIGFAEMNCSRFMLCDIVQHQYISFYDSSKCSEHNFNKIR